MHITVSTPIVESSRVLQIRGLFDLPVEKTSTLNWNVELPLDQRPWNLGLIVGPSGCGKTTIARHLFAGTLARQKPLDEWPGDRSLLDAIPAELSIKDVAELLSGVGFATETAGTTRISASPATSVIFFMRAETPVETKGLRVTCEPPRADCVPMCDANGYNP